MTEVKSERAKLEGRRSLIKHVATAGTVLLIALGLGLLMLFVSAVDTLNYEELRRENDAKKPAGNAVLSDEAVDVHEVLNVLTTPSTGVQPAAELPEPSWLARASALLVSAIGALRAIFRLDLQRAETTLFVLLLVGWAILCVAWDKLTAHYQHELAWRLVDLPDESSTWNDL